VPIPLRRFPVHRSGSPWQNAWIESFNSRLRGELLNSWHFDSLLGARVIIEDWRCDDDGDRPRSATANSLEPNWHYSGSRPTNPKPHSGWTTKRVPVAAMRLIPTAPIPSHLDLVVI
jgi:putative transposase